MTGYEGQITALHKKIVAGEITATQLAQTYLDAIEKDNEKVNAYVTVTPEAAMASAQKVDDMVKAGQEIPVLAGIPMTLKDNLSTDGIETTCCSNILKGYVPIYDATVWKDLKNQGAVLLGKTNMDEFAMGSSSETSNIGGSLNPHNLGHVAGGSSGGVAAAVGANIAVYGLGSDTGGSIRQPASFCGLVGLKPTYGAVSRYGLIAYASSFDQIGPITTSVADAALVFDAISGRDPMDSTSSGRKSVPTFDTLSAGVKGKKIGIAKEYFEGIRDDVRASLESAIAIYTQQGAEIVYFDLPVLKYALPVYYILACAEASSNLGRYDGIRYGYRTESYNDINEMICKTRSEGFGAEVQRRILLGTYVLSSGYYDAYYKKAQSLRGHIVKSFQKAFEICDVMLAPTVPMTSFPLNFTAADPIETYLTDICTVPVNIAGLPGISIPCGFDGEGLPIGMQLIGKAFGEDALLSTAYAYETVMREQTFKSVEMGVR